MHYVLHSSNSLINVSEVVLDQQGVFRASSLKHHLILELVLNVSILRLGQLVVIVSLQLVLRRYLCRLDVFSGVDLGQGGQVSSIVIRIPDLFL